MEILNPFNLDKKISYKALSIAASIIVTYSTFRLLSVKKSDKSIKEIPTPKNSFPYIGHLFSLGELPGQQVAKWHEELGDVIKLKMGTQTWVLISDPYIAHSAIAKCVDRPYTTFSHKYSSHGGKGIVFSNYASKYWKKARAALLSVLAPKMVDQYVDVIEHEAGEFAKRLIDATKTDGSIDPILTTELYAFNIISQVCLGRQFKSVEDEDFLKLSKILIKGVKQLEFARDLPNFLPGFWIINKILGVESKMAHHIDVERDPFLKKLIDEAVATNGPNIMKALSDESFSLDDENKLVIFRDSLTGGTGTIFTTIYWGFAILCQRLDIQKKIQDELDEFIKENNCLPTFSDHDQLTYCVSVVKEVLRYRPVTQFGIPHLATEDTVAGEYIIPKGSVVLSSMDHMHKNTKVYDNAHEFIPERFLNNNKSMLAAANGKIEDRDQYNFGWGRRICPGIYLSEVEILSSYISIFSRCTVEPITDSEGKPILPDLFSPFNAGVTQIPKAFRVRFVERSNKLI